LLFRGGRHAIGSLEWRSIIRAASAGTSRPGCFGNSRRTIRGLPGGGKLGGRRDPGSRLRRRGLSLRTRCRDPDVRRLPPAPPASCDALGRLSDSLVGSPMLAVRLPAIACHAALRAGWYVLGISTLKSHRAALAVVALGLTSPPVIAGAVLMTIDPPFLACWTW